MREDLGVRRIGALAAAAGVTVDALRFYERERLLPQATRTAGGFRLYGPEVERRLQFIKQARQLGLTLREIRDLVEPENCACAAMRGVIAARLADVDERLRELVAFRKTLRSALARCDRAIHTSKKPPCPVARRLDTVRSSH